MEKDTRELIVRIKKIRRNIMDKYPFYAALLLRLEMVFADCDTAATDMKKLYLDPRFIERLKDKEVEFVFLHEVMHCVLAHCKRGKDKDHELYNIAADIVVNSIIMKSMGISNMIVDGEPVIHRAPNGAEGYRYNVEQVYKMLLENCVDILVLDDSNESDETDQIEDEDKSQNQNGNGKNQKQKEGQNEQKEKDRDSTKSVRGCKRVDNHAIWDKIKPYDISDELWKNYVKDAFKMAGSGATPGVVIELLDGWKNRGRMNWREILQDFIQLINDRYDYLFAPPDRRFMDSEYILPSYVESDTEYIDDIWFVVDTSGSVSREMLANVYGELAAALKQFDNLSGTISFFDTAVSSPIPFDSIESLEEILPVGGGGTSFHIIFDYMKENMMKKLPKGIVILTDGYASYPAEKSALSVPVLWILQNNNKSAPFGKTIHMQTE